MKKWVLYLIRCLFVCFNLDPDRTCKPTEFLCTSTFRCIPKVWLCDGDSDCPNNEDEDVALGCSMCQTLLSSGVNFQKLVIVWFSWVQCWIHVGILSIQTDPHQCYDDEFQCQDGQCIKNIFYCDDDHDCKDGSDEPPFCCKYMYISRDVIPYQLGEKSIILGYCSMWFS